MVTDRAERTNGVLRIKARRAEKAYLCLGGVIMRFCRASAGMDTRTVAIREQRRSETQGVLFQEYPPILVLFGERAGC